MSNKEKNTRPTSPHLQIYAWNISSFTSILHRFTGIFLYFSIVMISWYVIFYAYQINIESPSENCDCPLNQCKQYLIYAIISAIVFSLYYHLCNGVRHLFWDIGKGFNIKTARFNAFLVIITSIVFTACTIAFVIYFKFM